MIQTAIAPRSPLTLTPAPIASVAAAEGGVPGDFAGSLAAMLGTVGTGSDVTTITPAVAASRQPGATTGKGLPDAVVADPALAWLNDPIERAPMPSSFAGAAIWPAPRVAAAPAVMPVAAGNTTTSAALATSALTPVPAFAEPAPIPQPIAPLAPNADIRADAVAPAIQQPIAARVDAIVNPPVRAEAMTTATTQQPTARETPEKTALSVSDPPAQTDRDEPTPPTQVDLVMPVLVTTTPVVSPPMPAPAPMMAADARPDVATADTTLPSVRAGRLRRASGAAMSTTITTLPLETVVAPARRPNTDTSARTDDATPRRDPAMPVAVPRETTPAASTAVVAAPVTIATTAVSSPMIAPTRQTSDAAIASLRAPAATPVETLPIGSSITPAARFIRAPEAPVPAAMPMPPATGGASPGRADTPVVAQPAGAAPASIPAGSPTLQVAATILSAMPAPSSLAQGAADASSTAMPDPMEQAPVPLAEPTRWSLPAATAPSQPQAGTVASAAQVFGAAMRAVVTPDERGREPADGMTSVLGPTAPQATAPVAAVTQAPLDMRHERWPEAMIARIEILRDAADANDTRIRLVPDALGAIDVSVKRDGDTVHVHFAAEQAATRTLLQDAQPRLADLAESRGLKLAQSGTGASVDSQAGQQRQPATPQPRVPTAPPRATRTADADTDSRLA